MIQIQPLIQCITAQSRIHAQLLHVDGKMFAKPGQFLRIYLVLRLNAGPAPSLKIEMVSVNKSTFALKAFFPVNSKVISNQSKGITFKIKF